MHTEAHLFSVPNDCLWYDKLWGPSQRVVTLLHLLNVLQASKELHGSHQVRPGQRRQRGGDKGSFNDPLIGFRFDRT